MSDVEALRNALAEIIPFNLTLSISITSVSPDSVELSQPEAPERLNNISIAHTGAATLFVLGEAAIEAMVIHAFYDLIKEGVVPFALKTTITYHRPTRGELRGISTLSPQKQTCIRDELTHSGRASFPISTRLLEESGLLVATLEAQWGLRKPRTKA